MYVYLKATKKIKMEIHVWVNRIIIKNMLANPEAYVKGYPFIDNEGYKNSKQLFLETEPSFSRWLDIQRFSLLLQVGNSHNNPIILHLNYCNGLFSAPAQLHSFRYFPKEHFLLYCFVQDTTFPPPSYHSNQSHTHLCSHFFINRVDSQAGEPSIILSLILQQDFPGEVSFTLKWFNLQTGAIPLPCNSQAHHPYFSHVFAFVFNPISQWADLENTSPYKRVIFLLV